MNETRPDESPAPRDDASPAAESQTAESPDPQTPSQPPPEGGAEPEGGVEPEMAAEAAPVLEEDVAPAAAKPRGAGFALFLAFVALVVALAAGAGAGLNWWTGRQAAGTGADAASLAATARGAADAVAQRVGSLEQRLAALEQDAGERDRRVGALRDQLGRAENRLSGLAAAGAGMPAPAPERAPTVADAEHLLVIANRELALAGNHRVALAALREAATRLQAVDDPAFLPARQAISDDIAAIEAMASSGGEEIALRLGSLAARVPSLPVKATLAPALESGSTGPAGESGWQRFKRRLGDLVTGLFRVRRVDRPATPLLSPDEIFFLQRNVELDLKSARLAAMSGDQGNYVESLRSAREAVSAYFLEEDPAVESFLAALDELRTQEVARSWPDLSGTVEALRSAAAKPAAAPARPAAKPAAKPAEAPAKPAAATAEPAEAPAEPAEAISEPAGAPADPAEAPAEPAEAISEPAGAPTDPAEAPAEPAETPPEPAETP